MAQDTRQRMVEAAAQLMRTHGLAGTSFTEVLEASGAARGAIYHHFPGGKAELAQAAVAWTGTSVQSRLASLEAGDARGVVSAFLAAVRPVVAESVAGAGCAVAAATVECPTPGGDLGAASREAFASWVGELARLLVDRGTDAAAAASMASLLVIFLEGAHLLCRAEGSLAPFDRGAEALVAAGQAMLPA